MLKNWSKIGIATKYTDAEAVAAMGAKANDNPLSHDRYTNAEALAAAKAGAGVEEGDLVQLDATGLPAVDGSQLTGIGGGGTDLFDSAKVTVSAALTAKSLGGTLVGSGSINGEAYAILTTGATVSSSVVSVLFPACFPFDKNQKARFVIYRLECAAAAGCNIYIIVGRPDRGYYGFKIVGDAEGTKVYAVNKILDGSETATDISAHVPLEGWDDKILDVAFTAGVDAKFYVDGVLRATHTTNLPTAVSPWGDPLYLKVENGETVNNVKLYAMDWAFQIDV